MLGVINDCHEEMIRGSQALVLYCIVAACAELEGKSVGCPGNWQHEWMTRTVSCRPVAASWFHIFMGTQSESPHPERNT